MQIPVLIEPVSGNGFRATSGGPLAIIAEGRTSDEALHRLQEQIRARLVPGAQVVPLETESASPHPWAPFAGMFRPDDPLVQDWLQIMANQRQAEQESDVR